MHGFDGTGPEGREPMTGGARGWCNPYSAAVPRYSVASTPYPGPARTRYPRPAAVYPVYGRGRTGGACAVEGYDKAGVDAVEGGETNTQGYRQYNRRWSQIRIEAGP